MSVRRCCLSYGVTQSHESADNNHQAMRKGKPGKVISTLSEWFGRHGLFPENAAKEPDASQDCREVKQGRQINMGFWKDFFFSDLDKPVMGFRVEKKVELRPEQVQEFLNGNKINTRKETALGYVDAEFKLLE